MALEYCVVVEEQHNYTDSENEAREWYDNEIKTWIEQGKKYRKPELIAREQGTGRWFSIMNNSENEKTYQIKLTEREKQLLAACILLKRQSVTSWYGYSDENMNRELLDKLSNELRDLYDKVKAAK